MKPFTSVFSLSIFLLIFHTVISQISFNTETITTPQSAETNLIINNLPNADSETFFAFRTVGTTTWTNGLFAPPSYFAISTLRKVTSTSTSSGTVLLSSFALSEDSTQEITVFNVKEGGWSVSATSKTDIINGYPIAATSSLISGTTFKNFGDYIFGDDSAFPFPLGKRTTVSPTNLEDNYGTIIATRIIGFEDGENDVLKCRVSLHATGVLRSVFLGDELILADSSLAQGEFKTFTTDDKYTFTKSDYQLLSIFSTVDLQVDSTELVDCEATDGTAVASPTLSIYSIVENTGSATTSTVPKDLTCFSSCQQCNKDDTCLQTTCLFNPLAPECIQTSSENCPAEKPYALQRSDIRGQCFKSFPNQALITGFIPTSTNITIGASLAPPIADVITCNVFSEGGFYLPSSSFFFPVNPNIDRFYGVRASETAATWFIFAYPNINPDYPFAPKTVTQVRLTSSTYPDINMRVRKLDTQNSAETLSADLNNIQTDTLNGYEFAALNQFTVNQGKNYILEFYIVGNANNCLSFKVPTSAALIFTDGIMEAVPVVAQSLIYYPINCYDNSPCFIHIAFSAESDGTFQLDSTQIPTNYFVPTSRAIKDIVLQSHFCPTGSSVKSNPRLCECEAGFFPNSTDATCQPCNEICGTCTGSTEQECTSCFPPFTLVGSECLCGAGLVREGLTCVEPQPSCDETCGTCSGPTSQECTSCFLPFILVGSECLCGAGLVREGLTCVEPQPSSCDETCSTCSGPTGQECTSCFLPFTLVGSECLCGAGLIREGLTCVPIKVITEGNTGNKDSDDWVRILYLSIYGVSFLTGLYLLKRSKAPVLPMKSELSMTVDSINNIPEDDSSSFKNAVINHSPLFFSCNKKLNHKEKLIRGFQVIFFLNLKLFFIALMAAAFNVGDYVIISDDVKDKAVQIIIIELILTNGLNLLYLAMIKVHPLKALHTSVFFALASIGIVVLSERFSLSRLEGEAGALLLAYFLISFVIDYIIIELILALLSMKFPIIKKLRSFNFTTRGKISPAGTVFLNIQGLANRNHSEDFEKGPNSLNELDKGRITPSVAMALNQPSFANFGQINNPNQSVNPDSNHYDPSTPKQQHNSAPHTPREGETKDIQEEGQINKESITKDDPLHLNEPFEKSEKAKHTTRGISAERVVKSSFKQEVARKEMTPIKSQNVSHNKGEESSNSTTALEAFLGRRMQRRGSTLKQESVRKYGSNTVVEGEANHHKHRKLVPNRGLEKSESYPGEGKEFTESPIEHQEHEGSHEYSEALRDSHSAIGSEGQSSHTTTSKLLKDEMFRKEVLNIIREVIPEAAQNNQEAGTEEGGEGQEVQRKHRKLKKGLAFVKGPEILYESYKPIYISNSTVDRAPDEENFDNMEFSVNTNLFKEDSFGKKHLKKRGVRKPSSRKTTRTQTKEASVKKEGEIDTKSDGDEPSEDN